MKRLIGLSCCLMVLNTAHTTSPDESMSPKSSKLHVPAITQLKSQQTITKASMPPKVSLDSLDELIVEVSKLKFLSPHRRDPNTRPNTPHQ